jgi:hypothetical protein
MSAAPTVRVGEVLANSWDSLKRPDAKDDRLRGDDLAAREPRARDELQIRHGLSNRCNSPPNPKQRSE